MNALPYAGLRVVEIGSRIAVAACGRLLADLGAKVDVLAASGDVDTARGKWCDRAVATAGKRLRVVDPAELSDPSLLANLVGHFDVVLVSSDADPLPSPAALRDAPGSRAIFCDITAFGSTGPLAGRFAEDVELQALTGVLATTGPADGRPVPIGLPVLEMSAALYAASAIATALHVLRRDGVAQSIEVALFDVGINALTTFMPVHFAGGEPKRLGNGHGMAVPWNAYPAADGWVLICSTNDGQWQRLAALIDPLLPGDERYATLWARLDRRGEVDALVSRWTRALPLDSAVDRLQVQGIPCGRIVPLRDLDCEPNLVLRDSLQHVHDPVQGRRVRVPSALIRFDGEVPAPLSIPALGRTRSVDPEGVRADSGNGRPALQVPASRSAAPFAGLRVVEIGQLTTAPLAARHLASFGADVVKIEPPGGESARAWAPLRDGVSHFFVVSNGEKRSMALDLRDPGDAARLRTLLAEADVLVENMKPGALARLGFDAPGLLALNPGLIYCAISGFGARSAYEGRPAVDTVIQAMSGMMDATRGDGVPLKAGISAADIGGGEAGLLAIVAALARREQTGRGCVIDLSMQDVGVWMCQTLLNILPPAVESPDEILSVAQACTHPQTIARGLIERPADQGGRMWEVFASPMRLSHTSASIGTLIGAPSLNDLGWKDGRPGSGGLARASSN